jgi:hypothetical protein
MFRGAAFAVAMVCAASLVQAHGPKGSKLAGVNGGEIADVDGGHLELVIGAADMKVYVTDLQDKPLASAGMAGRVIILDGTKQSVVPLVALEPNILTAPLPAPLSKDAKVAVSATLTKDGKPVQARFVVK